MSLIKTKNNITKDFQSVTIPGQWRSDLGLIEPDWVSELLRESQARIFITVIKPETYANGANRKGQNVLLRLAEQAVNGPTDDISASHDQYLYKNGLIKIVK